MLLFWIILILAIIWFCVEYRNSYTSKKYKHMSNLHIHIPHFNISRLPWDSIFCLFSIIMDGISIKIYLLRNHERAMIDSRHTGRMSLNAISVMTRNTIPNLTTKGGEAIFLGIVLFIISWVIHNNIKTSNEIDTFHILALFAVVAIISVFIILFIPYIPKIMSLIDSVIFDVFFCIMLFIAICFFMIFG